MNNFSEVLKTLAQKDTSESCQDLEMADKASKELKLKQDVERANRVVISGRTSTEEVEDGD